MSKRPIFKPFPLFIGCHAQTIAASFLAFARDIDSLKRFVYLSDGEKLVLEITTPKGWKESDPTVVMVHGLCGSHRSSYILRLTRKLYKEGIRSVRVNLRGCGSGRGHAKKMYHVDASEDIWQALKEIKRDTPTSPLTLVGFSLGGNIILKMGGERGEEAKDLVDKIISVNPPIDMQSSVEQLCKNKVYERFFMNFLREEVAYRHKVFEDLPPIEIPHEMSLSEFDEFYIAPQSGYHSAQQYYRACSSGRVIQDIVVPCYILFSKDDPIVDCNGIDPNNIPENVHIVISAQGGHLGFLGIPGKKGGFHWMDSVVLEWIFKDSLNT